MREKTRKAGFPGFRGRGWWHSFGFRQFTGITFDGGRLRFKGMPGALKVHVHRPMPDRADIRSCMFRRDTKGWKVGFAVDIPADAARVGERSVGIDLGISTFAALSDGGVIPSLKAARRAQRKLRAAQRSLSRKQRRPKNRAKAGKAVARCHAATAWARLNFLHQASARLLRDYDVIAVESLNVKALAQSMLARDVHDASWGKFISIGLGPRLPNVAHRGERAGGKLTSARG